MNALILLAALILFSCASVPPCDVRNPEMIAHGAECRLRVQRECANVRRCRNAATLASWFMLFGIAAGAAARGGR